MAALWIWCDIDGAGYRWRLAVERGGMLYFPVEDFEVDGELCSGYPSAEIGEPTHIPVEFLHRDGGD